MSASTDYVESIAKRASRYGRNRPSTGVVRLSANPNRRRTTGYMAVFFNVAAPFNFSSYQYLVVLNTTGSGVTPSTQTFQTNWAGYSYAILARGNGATSYAQAGQYRLSPSGHAPPGWLPLGTTPQTFSYNLNANGTQTEFSILARTGILSSPGPSPSPSPSNVWTFNAFTTQANGSGQWLFYDSLGFGGPNPPEFVSPKLCMTEPFDNTYYAQFTQVPDPAAQISTIEIANNPPSPSPCP